MPRPKTYGKKSRTLGGPQILDFSSPEQQSRKCSIAGEVDKCAEIRLPSKSSDSGINSKTERKVLGERNANSSVTKESAEPKNSCRSEHKSLKRSQTTRRRISRPAAADACSSESQPASVREVSSSTPVSRQTKASHVRKHIFFDEENADAEEQEIIEIKHINKASLDAASEIVAQSPDVDNVDNVFHKHCSSLLALSSHPYSAFSSFDSWSTEVESLFAVSKLAEASFGEVYRLSLLDDIPDFSKADESVFKIIALKGPASTHPSDKRKRAALLKREELMSTPADVANEVRLLQRMTHIPGFTNFRDIRILQGRPSGPFITAFHDFDKKQRARGKEGSHFPDPAKKSSYAETQLWAIIEMQDAGSDLERLVEAKQCTSIWGTWDLFWHTTLALAKGEQGARFEHRDLHLGNICVRNLPGESSITEMEKIGDWLAEDVDMKRKLAFTPLETTIIDYTLSRATLKSIDDDGDEDEIEDEKNIAYMDLSRDPAIFQGDSTDEYQYDIYRYMRGVLYHDDAYHDFEANDQAERNQKADVEASPRSWSQYHPQTNLVWLHFILYMLLEQVIWPSETRAPTKRPGKTNRDEQARHKLRVAKHKRGKQLEAVLLELQAILDPEQICANGVRSAGDLVALAMSEGWLDLQDVIGRSMELVDGEEELEVEFEALKL